MLIDNHFNNKNMK